MYTDIQIVTPSAAEPGFSTCADPRLGYPNSKTISRRPERQASASGAASLHIRHYYSSISKKLFRRGAEPPYVFFSDRNKRWLDFARHDTLVCRDIPTGKSLKRLGHSPAHAAVMVLLHLLLLLLQVIVKFLLLIVVEQIADFAVAGLVDAPHLGHLILAGCR